MRRTVAAVLKTSDGTPISPTNTLPITGVKTQVPLGNNTLTIINASATSLSGADAPPAGAEIAVIGIEGGNVRFWLDGTIPDPSLKKGLVVAAGQSLVLENATEISGFQAKAETVDVTCNIQYFGGA